MALFGSKKKAVAVKKVETKAVVPVRETVSLRDMSAVIVRPRVTEKASMKAENNVFVFEVSSKASKPQVARAVKEMYNVTPVKVRVVAIPSKQVFIRNKPGVKNGGRKAYVYLKKGETIEFV